MCSGRRSVRFESGGSGDTAGASQSKQGAAGMPNSDPVGRDPLDEKVRAWWLEVLAGEQGRDHPIYGPNLRAKLRGDILEVSGRVESTEAEEKLRAEIHTLNEGGICRVRLKVAVVEAQGDRGVLKQTIMAFYTNAAQSRMAERYLEGHPGVTPIRVEVLDEQSVSPVLKDLAKEWRRELADGFRRGKSLLLVEVDEVEAFRAIELLDDTKGVEILVLPPKV
jgi:hypothetical protein